MFIKCDNKDIFWCLLFEGWACDTKDGFTIGIRDGFRKIEPKKLEKYKEVFHAEIAEDGPEFDDYRTLREYNPRWLIGMGAQNYYKKYFGTYNVNDL